MIDQFPGVEETGRTLATVVLGAHGSTKRLIEIEEETYYDLAAIGEAMGEEPVAHVERVILGLMSPPLNPARRARAPAHRCEPQEAPRRASARRLSLLDTPRRA